MALPPATIPPSRTWSRRLRRIAFRLTRSILLAYVVAILVFAAFQTQLIFPGTSTHGAADSIVSPPPQTELLHLTTATGIPIVALFASAQQSDGSLRDSANAASLLYFYGNAMCLRDSLGEVQQFRRIGFNVLAVEYPGYGMSGGSASEANCYAAAEAAYQYVLGRPDLRHDLLVPAGWSLGGAVAIDLAARHAGDHHLAGIMTFSTFTSMTDLGRLHYPMFPVNLMLHHHFDSLSKVGTITVPYLLGHGKTDEIAPFAMSDRLAAAAGVPVTRLSLADVGHNDFFDAGEAEITAAAGHFLRQLTPAP